MSENQKRQEFETNLNEELTDLGKISIARQRLAKTS
jgi:hypothetical protein